MDPFRPSRRSGALTAPSVPARYIWRPLWRLTPRRGLPAFVYLRPRRAGCRTDSTIPCRREGKNSAVRPLRLRCRRACGARAYVGIGSVSMGIMGSFCNPQFFQDYLGIRAECVDMTEVLRRMEAGDLRPRRNMREPWPGPRRTARRAADKNPRETSSTPDEQKEEEWALRSQDGPDLPRHDAGQPQAGRNGLRGRRVHGPQRHLAAASRASAMWSDWQPNGDFTEAFLNTSFDWTRQFSSRFPVATENDSLNAVSMLFGNLLTDQRKRFRRCTHLLEPRGCGARDRLEA